MKLPLVDVVVVTYNQEEFIAETIESVLNQSYKNIRIIVSDDGSRDKTQEIIGSYANKYPNIVPVLSRKNTGIASNFNRALKQVRGKYVAWLGGDDLMLPEKIEIQVDFLESNSDFSGCYTDAEVFEYPSGKVLGLFSEIFGNGKLEEVIDIKKFLDPKTYLLPSTFLIRREFIPSYGFDTRFRFLNDFIFDAEIIAKAPFGGIPKVLVRYRRHKRNVTKSDTLKEIAYEENLMAIALLEARYPSLSKYLKKRKTQFIIKEIIKAFQHKDDERAKKLIKSLFYEKAYLEFLGLYIAGGLLSRLIKSKKTWKRMRDLFYR